MSIWQSIGNQDEGLKHTDDKWDSFCLTHMYRLGILPQGYIYPKEDHSEPLMPSQNYNFMFILSILYRSYPRGTITVFKLLA